MKQLLQRLSLGYHARALSEHETKEYVAHRLRVAGIENLLFSDDAEVGSSADTGDLLQGAYGPIASRASVEISRKLKRIGDANK